MKHNLFGHLIGTANILSTNVLLIKFTGSHDKAIFLSQLIYWTHRSKRKDGFFAKSYSHWYDEIIIKEQSIRRFTKKFVEMGFLKTEIHKFNNIPTLHYKVDLEKLEKMLLEFLSEKENETSKNTENRPLSNCKGTPIKLSDLPLSNCKGTPIKLSEPINIDYNIDYNIDRGARDPETENKDIPLKPTEELKEPPKQQELQLDWKPAANEIITDKDALLQIKDQSGYKDNIREFCKAYFLNLVAKGEWFRLTVPDDPGEKYKWRAKHIAGITSWIIRDKKFYPNRKKKKQDEEKLAPYHKHMFDYSILEK